MPAKMTRYLWCPKCYRALITKKGLKSAKGVRFIYSGEAEDDLFCDNCMRLIRIGDPCFAITFVDKRSDHKPWEDGYLADKKLIEDGR